MNAGRAAHLLSTFLALLPLSADFANRDVARQRGAWHCRPIWGLWYPGPVGPAGYGFHGL